jgi:hypothetical protein
VHGRHNGQRGTDTYDYGRKSGRHGLGTIPTQIATEHLAI